MKKKLKKQSLWRKIKCHFNFHSWRTVGSGYPPFQKKWTKMEYCPHCRSWRKVLDDVFAPPRDETKYPLEQDFFVFEDTYKKRISEYIHSIKNSQKKSPQKQ